MTVQQDYNRITAWIDNAKQAFLARVQDTLHDATLEEVDYFWRCGLEPRDSAICIHSRRKNQKGGA